MDAVREKFGGDAIVKGRGFGIKLERQGPSKVESVNRSDRQRIGTAFSSRFPPARNSAHCSIKTRRRSNRSERAYAAST